MAKELKLEHNIKLFDDYIEILFNKNDNNEIDKIYTNIIDNINALKLPNQEEVLKEYRDIIIDSHKIKEHFDILRILKNMFFINGKIVDIEAASFKCKTFNSAYHKIALIRNIEQMHNIINYELSHLNNKTSIIFDDSLFKLIKGAFRTTKKKPSNNLDVLKLYVTLLKSITTSDIIISKYKSKSKNDREYYINDELLLYHLKIDKYTNTRALNYDVNILKYINYDFEDTVIYNNNITIFNDGDYFDSD